MKLFINPGPVLHVLHLQGPINLKHKELFERISQRLQTRDELDALNFEMFNNLVVESTRLGIEVKNLRMQVESLSTRLDFDERRSRALEGVVQYKPGTPIAPPPAGATRARDRGAAERVTRPGARRAAAKAAARAAGVAAAVAGVAGFPRRRAPGGRVRRPAGEPGRRRRRRRQRRRGDGEAPSSPADEGAPVAESSRESAPDDERPDQPPSGAGAGRVDARVERRRRRSQSRARFRP